jgi:hypothetical protein
MINFVTLNTIVTDLLEIIRQAKVSRSEPISKRQLEAWVHQYRALLIKRDLDKGKMPNPDYIQEIPAIELEVVDTADDSNVTTYTYVLKTKLAIPNTIDLNNKSGFMYVGTIDGRELQFIPEGRSQWQQYKKYSQKESLVFLRNKYLYLLSVTPLKYLTVRGVFEVPTEVGNFVNPNMPTREVGIDDPYPIPINMIPTLKEMILKGELNIEMQAPSDNSNDSSSLVSSNIEK